MISSRALVSAWLLVIVAACGGSNDTAAAAPSPRPSDPLLSHSWTMPVTASPVAQADLGTQPESLADEMMNEAAIAGIVHRIATRCDELDLLPRPGEVALRFALAEGALREVEADPPTEAGRCLADSLRSEGEALKSLSAGAALLRVQLHP